MGRSLYKTRLDSARFDSARRASKTTTETRTDQSRYRAAPGCIVITLGLMLLTGEAAAQLGTQGATAPGVDERRLNSGARITAETGVHQDTAGASDDKRMSKSYQPRGVDLGMFLLLPKLETDATYNSNIYATRDGAKSDFYATIRPELTLRSRFAQHELNAKVVVEKFLYNKHKANNRLDFQSEISGRYDVQQGTEVTLFSQYYSGHEDRTSPDEAGGVKPTPTQGFIGRLGLKHEVGRTTLSGDLTAQRMTFDPVYGSTGALVPNQDRDRWELEGRLRGAYEMFPGYAAVVQTSANTRRYDDAFDRNGYQRDSHGYRIEGGVGVDISQLLRGDFLIGYLSQNYKDARLSDPSGLSVRATFNWTPDKLLVVVPSIERVVSETTRAGASAQLRTTGSLLVRYEAARNIILTSYLAATYSENTGQSPTDWTYQARLRGTYMFTPEVFVGAEAAHKTKETRNERGGFDQTTLMIRLGLQL